MRLSWIVFGIALNICRSTPGCLFTKQARCRATPGSRRCPVPGDAPPPGAGRVQSRVPCPGDTGDDTGLQMRPLCTYSGTTDRRGKVLIHCGLRVYLSPQCKEKGCTRYIAARYCTLQAHLNRCRQIWADCETADFFKYL